MAYSEYYKYLEEELKRQQELLGKEREKAIEEARRILGLRGVGRTGIGAKELGRIEEAYSRALGQLLSEYSARKTQLKMAEQEEKKRRLASILQGLIMGGTAIFGLLGSPVASLGIVGQEAVKQMTNTTNPTSQSASNPTSTSQPVSEPKIKKPSKFEVYSPYLIPEIGKILAGLTTGILGLPGYEAMAYGIAGIGEIPQRIFQQQLLDLQRQLLASQIEFYRKMLKE